MKNILMFALLAALFASCSSSSDDEVDKMDKVEVYSSYDWISTGPADETISESFTIPQNILEILEPTLVEEVGEWGKDTLDLKSTSTDYRLVLRNLSAELEVKTDAKLRVIERRQKSSLYLFKEGKYKVNGIDTYEVKQDGIYYVRDGKIVCDLTDYRYLNEVDYETASSKDFTKHIITIAKGQATSDVFMVSKADTTYQCSRISDKQIQLDMISPSKENISIMLSRE